MYGRSRIGLKKVSDTETSESRGNKQRVYIVKRNPGVSLDDTIMKKVYINQKVVNDWWEITAAREGYDINDGNSKRDAILGSFSYQKTSL